MFAEWEWEGERESEDWRKRLKGEGTIQIESCTRTLLGVSEAALQHFQVKCGLLGSEAGKGHLLDLGRMFANHAKTVYAVP